jgi:hypothetical protein
MREIEANRRGLYVLARDAAVRSGGVAAEEFDRAVDPKTLVGSGLSGA